MTSVKKSRQSKNDKLGSIVVEVIRATNEGQAPTSPKSIRRALDIPPSSLTGYLDELETDGYLVTNGHEVSLASETRILMDSQEVEALLQAYENRDENDCMSAEVWAKICKQLKITQARADKFLDDYRACSYLIEERSISGSFKELNVRNINEDMFFLKLARKAKLKRRPPRATT